MSELLAFQEALWAKAKKAAQQGHFQQTLRLLKPILRTSDHSRLTILAQRLAGRVFAQLQRFASARKFLRRALQGRDTCHESWYDLGQAYELDPYGCDRRAAQCYRRAMKLQPESAKYQAAYGLALVRANRLKKAFQHLQQARLIAPDCLQVLPTIVTAYLEADRPDLAEELLREVRFRAAKNPAIQDLVRKVRYATSRCAVRPNQPKLSQRVLPLLRVSTSPEASPTTGVGVILRQDFASAGQPHLRARRERG